MKEYQRLHKEVTILDPPEAIQRLHNRESMLEAKFAFQGSRWFRTAFQRQQVVSNIHSPVPDEVAKAGLSVPLVVKPLVVDGSAKCHELFLAYDHFSLSELEAPVVLQEFVNHDFWCVQVPKSFFCCCFC
ncbi:Inositol-tetrakisphosphate 1-kinase 2 [Striga hermonthica]|uniref:inositol-1,3,4-trisphosphate 5/6-kinase n=1 Tax=Striga hermonthica TaxID=68872 RepID=A0A9N7MLA6_STRHE|nr:Inositol-tetrakisphosphate 1-kinase 2 [Striga hermonthica]